MKKIGILGGIGPEASSYVYAEIIRRLRKGGTIKRNADYPHILINSINAPELVSMEVPDDMLAPYVRGIKELASQKPDYILMACNTIHLFREQLVRESGYENISDISQVVAGALADQPGTICVIGTATTVTSGLYQVAGRTYANPHTSQLTDIGQVIINYNATGEIKKNRATLLRIIKERRTAGAEIFVAGCTEISELLRGIENLAVVDTLELLVEDTLRRITTN